ncbi:MAG TPA: PEPxxWA-CTERM sorting domain-containing protein, partial [Phenylobacterium sp.]
ATAAPASAALVLGTSYLPGLGAVHNNGTQTSQVVTGTLNSAGDITYASPDILHTNGNGVAQVNGPFSQIQVLPTAAAFNIGAINWALDINQGGGGTPLPVFLNITVFPTVGSPEFLNGIALSTGENKFSLFDNGGATFSSVLFNTFAADHTTPENVDSLRQVEITTTGGGVVRGGGGVPEPASWAMMILGFFGVGGLLRTRRRLAAAG